MTRVLHVIGPLRTGGAQTQLLGLIREAHGTLWDATVVATSGGTLVDDFRALGCEVTVLRRLASPGFGRMWRLRQIVRRGGFDVIHGNLWQSNLYCRIAVLGLKDRPAVVISERNVEAERSRFKRFLDARLARVTDAFVGNTDAVGVFIKTVHPTSDSEVVVIPNAVDTRIFFSRHSPRVEAIPVIGTVGRLDPEKGFDVLIEAIRVLQGRGTVVDLRIVGSGPLRDQLESRANGLRVEFLGNVAPGREVADFLRGLDVFCLPSTFREGRPNVILEALACDLPVVATSISGIDEVIRGDTLVAPGNAVELADALATAVDDPAWWRLRSSPARLNSFRMLADDYRGVFERAVGRRR